MHAGPCEHVLKTQLGQKMSKVFSKILAKFVCELEALATDGLRQKLLEDTLGLVGCC